MKMIPMRPLMIGLLAVGVCRDGRRAKGKTYPVKVEGLSVGEVGGDPCHGEGAAVAQLAGRSGDSRASRSRGDGRRPCRPDRDED